MKKEFNCTNCGFCCGPIPINQKEFKRIKLKVKKLPFHEIDRLKQQKRSPLDCIFRDIEKNQCSIYEARPKLCKMFGFYEGMKCPNNPKHATKTRTEGNKRIEKNMKGDKIIGVLSQSIYWSDFLKT